MLLNFVSILLGFALVRGAPFQLKERAGPSGYVIRPAEGYQVPDGGYLYFEYQPVFWQDYPAYGGTEGLYGTSYIDIDIYNPDLNITTPLARGLSAESSTGGAALSIIDATINFDWVPNVCGNVSLVVTEYQVGFDAPTAGFESASQNINIPGCGNWTSYIPTGDSTLVISPTANTTLLTGRTFRVCYEEENFGQGGDYIVDVDIQDASADPDDDTSYTTVVHGLSMSLNYFQCFEAYFLPDKFGSGDKRLRFTDYSSFSSIQSASRSFVSVTISEY